jgi:glycosyltransferase involved in cell wall biosynthesis
LARTGTNPLADLRSLFALWRLMRQLQPDWVLAYTIKPVIYGSLAAWLAGVPRRFALIPGLGYSFLGEGKGRAGLQTLVQKLYGAALARVHGVFFQNPDDAALFKQRSILPSSVPACVVNGSGVDVARFAPAPLPTRGSGVHFLLIGRLLGDKGVREYAAAAQQVRAQYPGTTFSLVGGLDSNPDCIAQQELDAWVAAGTIQYLGKLSDVRPALAACSAYVLPSYREGAPRSSLEAMATGRAVITTDAPGCRETVVDGDNGFLVPVRDPHALAAAMLKFIQQPDLIATMGARSRQMAEEKYDVHKVNAVMLREMGLAAQEESRHSKTTLAMITSNVGTLTGFRAPLIRALQARGVRVLALAPKFDDKNRAAVRALGAEPIDSPMARTGMNPLVDAINTWKLARLLRHLQPNISLAYMMKPVVYGSIAARLAGVPQRFAMLEGLGFVFTPTGQPFSAKRRVLQKLVMFLLKLGAACASKLLFLNPDDRQELLAAGVCSPEKTLVLGGIGVDLLQWPALPPVTAPVTFLMVARLLREKGVADYAEAARLVKAQQPKARFVLLGGLDDNPGAITQEQVQAWADAGILEWHGHTAVPPRLAQASVFVLPSYREGVPASTQEAMASARAVITTDVPGCRETVVDGDNGFLVPVRDAQALAAAMLKFIQQPDLIATMGARSRQMAEKKYDVHKVNAVLLREMGLNP